MKIENLVGDVNGLSGNMERSGGVFVSAANVGYFADHLAEIDAKRGILITPYLMIRDGILYELHYYEFDVEVRGDRSYYVDYNSNNTLPEEITGKLKPQAIVAIGDKRFYQNAVRTYLSKMAAMEFTEEKEHYPQLRDAQLFYQIFIDSDLI